MLSFMLVISTLKKNTGLANEPLDLEGLVKKAAKKSIPALINEHKLKKAEFSQRNDFYAFFPTLDFETGRGLDYSLDEEADKFVFDSSNSMSLSLSIPIFANGSRFYQLKDGKLALEQVKIDVLDSMSQFIVDLIELYFNFHLTTAQLEITDFKRENVKTSLEKAKELVTLGIKTEIDVFDREIELAQIERSILNLNNSKKNILSKIKNYINSKKKISFKSIELGSYKPYYLSKFEKNIETIRSKGKRRLLENNLSIKSGKISLERSKLAYREESKKRWPKANLAASVNRDYGRFVNQLDEGVEKRPIDSASLSASLTWDLWDNYSIERTIGIAASNHEIDLLNFEKESRQVIQDYNEHLQNFTLLEQSIEISKLASEKAENQYNFAKEMYDLGKIPVSTLAGAIETRFRSQLQLIELKSEKLVLMATIPKTLGYSLLPSKGHRKAN